MNWIRATGRRYISTSKHMPCPDCRRVMSTQCGCGELKQKPTAATPDMTSQGQLKPKLVRGAVGLLFEAEAGWV